MNVTLAAAIFDPSGSVSLKIDPSKSKWVNGKRRTTRTKTLGGGVFIFDGGFSHGDRTLTFKINTISPDDLTILLHLRDNHTTITCSIEDEFFLGVIDDVNLDPSINITFLVKSRLSA